MKIPSKYNGDFYGTLAFSNGVRMALLNIVRIRAEGALKLGTEDYMREMLTEIVGICKESETEEQE